MPVLSPELRAWLVPGLAGAMAVVDENGLPCVARVWAARVVPDADVLELHVQASSGRRLIAALDVPRRGAVNLIDATTYRSRMFRGACELTGDAPDAAYVESGLAAISKSFHAIGMPVDTVERMLAHGADPHVMCGLRLKVESVFDQSPKPGAGALLACVP